MADMEREFNWDDTIEKDSTDFVLLQEGDYDFEVESYERARHGGSEKLPPCNKAVLKLRIPDAVDNAGKATKLLERLDKRKQEGLTTPKQIRFLEGRGFLHVGTWQFDTAKRLIDRIAANGWRIPSDINPAEYRGA